MNNIFDNIVGTLPKASDDDIAKLNELQATPQQAPVDIKDIYKDKSLKGLVLAWKQKETPETAALVLKKLKPTINAAMSSYAPGMDKQLSVKAARIALDSLKAYNPDAGTDPSTYVFHGLKRLYRVNSKRNNILPISEVKSLETKHLMEVITEFEDTYNREPSMEEMADITGFNMKKLDKLLNGQQVVSFSSTLSQDSRSSMVTSNDITDDDYFKYVYSSVDPINKKIMEMTKGMGKSAPMNNIQIAARLKITPAAVSQRKAKISKLLSDIRGLL